MSPVKKIFAAAIILMPLTYSAKLMLGLPEIIWINPTIILAMFIFLFIMAPIRPKVSFFIIISAIISACLGFIFLSPKGGLGGAMYAIAREPMRTILNLVWFWVSLYFIRDDRKFILKWLAISVIIQIVMAFYLWFGTLRLVPLPGTLLDYLLQYALAQVVWFGETPVIRLAGTFVESPPFGLFMFSAFVIFSISIFKERYRSRLVIWGWILSLIGIIGSLATQIFVALALFIGLGLLFTFKGKGTLALRIIVIVLMIIMVPYVTETLMSKLSETETGQAYEAYARSGGERIFHTQYGLNLLLKNPEYIPFGVGPGRYGAHASATGVFRITVTPQVTPVAWLVEHGLVGLFLIGWWLWLIARRAGINYGILGVMAFAGLLLANMFQGNWLWESWFLALAYIFAESNNSARTNNRTD